MKKTSRRKPEPSNEISFCGEAMGQVNKAEVVEALSKEQSLSIEEAGRIVETILYAMSDALSRGDSIQLRGLGTFHVKQYESYTGRNPKNGDRVSVKSKKSPVFKVGKELKKAVNSNRKR